MRMYVSIVACTLVAISSFNVYAQSNKVLIEGLSSCLHISNDELRLVCFDELAQENVTISNSVKMNEETVSEAEIAQIEEAKKIDEFAKDDLKKTKEEKGLDSITATLTKAKQLLRGEWVIYLDNGQKWQQKDSSRIKLKAGDIVSLKKGAMGAVYLSKDGTNRKIRVKRLQ